LFRLTAKCVLFRGLKCLSVRFHSCSYQKSFLSVAMMRPFISLKQTNGRSINSGDLAPLTKHLALIIRHVHLARLA